MLRDQVDPALLDVLDSVTAAPAGPHRVAAAEHAVAEARSSGSFAGEVLARSALAESLHHVPDSPDLLVHLAWLRQVVDRPEVVEDEGETHRIFWMLKWAPTQMLNLPQVPLDEVDRAVDDLEEVYRRNGFALRPVLGFRAAVAQERGQDDVLREVMTRWAAEPRDHLSDCAACDTAAQGMAWEHTDAEEALRAWRPLLDGGQQCTEEPHRARAHAALMRWDAGDTDGAARLVEAAWVDSRSESFNNEAVAHCLVAWTRMGNVDRALPALLDRTAWLDEIDVPHDRMLWTAASVAVLDAAEAAGIAPDDVAGRPRTEAREEWHRTATDLAAAFDARNGTSHHSDRLADWLDLSRVAATPHLPPLRLRSRDADPPPRPASVAAHAQAVRAETEAFGTGVDALLVAWVAHRDALLAEAGADDEADVALLERRAAAHAPDPRALLDRAAEAARASGDDVTVQRVEADRLDVLGADDPDQLSGLVAIAERLAAGGAHPEAAAVWRLAARHADSPARSEQLSLASVEEAERAGDRPRQGIALVEAARAAALDSPDRAADLVARARPLLAGHSSLELLADDTQARLLAGAGRHDDAIDLLRTALSREHGANLAITPRLLLCDLLVDAQRMDDLLQASEQVLADGVELGDPLVLALGQRFHGLALVEAGRPAEALDLLDAALPVITERLPDSVAPLRWAHAQALTLLGEPGPARASYAAAATAFEATDRLVEAGHAQYQAGQRAWESDDLAAAEAHFDAAVGFAEAERVPSVFTEASRLRAIVRRQSGASEDLAELDDVPADVRRHLEAWSADGTEARGPVPDVELLEVQVLRDGANLLAADGRFAEAAIRMESAESRWRDPGERARLRAERGLFLAGAQRWDDAEALVRDGLAGMDDQAWADVRHSLVQQWVSMLDDAGRTEDAQRIWDELG